MRWLIGRDGPRLDLDPGEGEGPPMLRATLAGPYLRALTTTTPPSEWRAEIEALRDLLLAGVDEMHRRGSTQHLADELRARGWGKRKDESARMRPIFERDPFAPQPSPVLRYGEVIVEGVVVKFTRAGCAAILHRLMEANGHALTWEALAFACTRNPSRASVKQQVYQLTKTLERVGLGGRVVPVGLAWAWRARQEVAA